jgi:uncharacterized membrane protein
MKQRLAALDWMRGFVMVLMTIDHASLAFNGGRVALDSAFPIDPISGAGWVPGSELPQLQFFVRWITHLCAPTFLFLSGTSLALSLEKRRGESLSERELDWHLFVRGAVVLGCEGILTGLAGGRPLMLQVLYAIGMSLWFMIPLRRLGVRTLVGLGLGWFVVGEAITTALVPIGSVAPLLQRLLVAPALSDSVVVIYPLMGWLAMMMLGWGFGRWLLGLPEDATRAPRIARACLQAGLAALVVFLAVRGIDAYGNMGLHRDDGSWVQWLHVSKYPPALAYALLELGVMGVCLAGFFAVESRLSAPASRWNPLRVYGETALFFYMLHFIGLLGAAIALSGNIGQYGLPEAAMATGTALVVLYPLCVGWRAYKRAHPRGWAQYV